MRAKAKAPNLRLSPKGKAEEVNMVLTGRFQVRVLLWPPFNG